MLSAMSRISRCVWLCLLLALVGCKSESSQDLPTLLRDLGEVRKLDLVEMRTEETIIISGSPYTLATIRSLDDAVGYIDDLLRTGNRVGVYSFVSYVGAFVDLSSLAAADVRVDPSRHRVELTLPAVQVEPLGRGTTLEKLHERVTGTQKSITNEERTALQNKASELLRRRIEPGEPLYNELVVRGQNKARAYFVGMLHARGYDEVTVSFQKEVLEHE